MSGTLEAFRKDTQAFLEKSAPASLRGRPMMMAEAGDEEAAEVRADRKRWLDAMAARGFTAPMWPTQYGGGGLSPAEAKVLQEEIGKLRMAPALMGMGLSMIGPTLLVHGSEAQKQKYLPKIISGEHRWCQGFSEPGAGSDLASLRCAAKLADDESHYVINGSKTWTSGAQYANWIFMLVRTDTTTKHSGISFILVDMQTPGIEVKPIRLISGTSPFCETFFTDVKGLPENVIGGVNNGWTVAKTLLNFERSGMGTGSMGGGAAAQRRGASPTGGKLAQLAKQAAGERDGKIADASLRDQVSSLLLDEMALQLTVARSAESRKVSGAPGPEISMFKLYTSELGHRRDELMLSLRGTGSLVMDGTGDNEDDAMLTRGWLGAKATTIYGGTSEIQRNIITKRVLRLPTQS